MNLIFEKKSLKGYCKGSFSKKYKILILVFFKAKKTARIRTVYINFDINYIFDKSGASLVNAGIPVISIPVINK